MEPKSTYSGNDSYFDGRDKELDASYLCRKLCKKKYQLEFEKGEIIIAQGEDVDACYYLEKGYVIAYETVKGRRRIFDAYNSNNLLLCSYAVVSIENNYCRPMMANDSVIEIKDGRHPVVEKMVNEILFTPNDVYLDVKSNRLMIITGPNMSGKSTFMRQVAVIVLMAQIGCFVPASYARLGVVDRIFTRVGASDDLSAGQSTFMVEMTEVATILNEATRNSLVILDEIGRGTSTYDGVSIAKAVAEYISSKAIGCKTLFATHYHELISLENELDGVRNYSVKVKRSGEDIKFLHKIVEGGTDDSYGIEVARLAGLPKKVTDRAKQLLAELEKAPKIQRELELRAEEESESQIDFEATGRQNVIAEIKNLDLDDMTPREAYAKLEELKAML